MLITLFYSTRTYIIWKAYTLSKCFMNLGIFHINITVVARHCVYFFFRCCYFFCILTYIKATVWVSSIPYMCLFFWTQTLFLQLWLLSFCFRERKRVMLWQNLDGERASYIKFFKAYKFDAQRASKWYSFHNLAKDVFKVNRSVKFCIVPMKKGLNIHFC